MLVPTLIVGRTAFACSLPFRFLRGLRCRFRCRFRRWPGCLGDRFRDLGDRARGVRARRKLDVLDVLDQIAQVVLGAADAARKRARQIRSGFAQIDPPDFAVELLDAPDQVIELLASRYAEFAERTRRYKDFLFSRRADIQKFIEVI